MPNNLKMTKRLKMLGGNNEERMIKRKEWSLKRSLFNSYQAATAILNDGRAFKCLINRDKLNGNYDNKIISIPYEDIELNDPRMGEQTTTQGQTTIDLKTGDTFLWKETNSHWIVYLEIIDEDAYFRAEIRRCDQQVTVNETDYWVYIRGPVETSIPWGQPHEIATNTPNYSLEMYITKDENTLAFFHRFKKLKIEGHRWETQAINPYFGDGIIQVFLKEDFDNTIEEEAMKEAEEQEDEEPIDTSVPYIDGESKIYPYDVITYTVKNLADSELIGKWSLNDKRIKAKTATKDSITIFCGAGKSGTFKLSYVREGEEDISRDIKILSL